MSEKSLAQVLREARELISDPKQWTRGAYARDVRGVGVGPAATEATCWCAVGAVLAVLGVEYQFDPKVGPPKRALAGVIPGGDPDITTYNDGPNHVGLTDYKQPRPAPARHRRVLAAFDRAIELAEADRP